MSVLECYMEELVDRFEDFVKKSLAFLSVIVGSVLVVVFYMVNKLCSSPPVCLPCSSSPPMLECTQSIPNFCCEEFPPKICRNRKKCSGSRSSVNKLSPPKNSYVLVYPEPCGATTPIPIEAATVPSDNEIVLNDTAYANKDNPDQKTVEIEPEIQLNQEKAENIEPGTHIEQEKTTKNEPVLAPVEKKVKNIEHAQHDHEKDVVFKPGTQVIVLRRCKSQPVNKRSSACMNTDLILMQNIGTGTGVTAPNNNREFGDWRRRCLYRAPSQPSVYSRRSIPCLPDSTYYMPEPSPCPSVTSLQRRHSCCSKCCH